MTPEIDLRPDLDAPASARRFVRAPCREAVDPEGVLIAVSDLVTDAVQRTDAPIRVEILLRPGTLELRVTPGPGTESGLSPSIAVLASDWGIEPDDPPVAWCRFGLLGVGGGRR
jgi:hypothetical protein